MFTSLKRYLSSTALVVVCFLAGSSVAQALNLEVYDTSNGNFYVVVGPGAGAPIPYATTFSGTATEYSGGIIQFTSGVNNGQWYKYGITILASAVELISIPAPSPLPGAVSDGTPASVSIAVSGATHYVLSPVTITATGAAGTPNAGQGSIFRIAGTVTGPGAGRSNAADNNPTSIANTQTLTSQVGYTDGSNDQLYYMDPGWPWYFLDYYDQSAYNGGGSSIIGSVVPGATYQNTYYTFGRPASPSIDLSWTPTAAGTYTVNATVNGSISATAQTITVLRIGQAALTLSASTSQGYGSTQTLSTTGGSGAGGVSYAIVAQSGGGVATLTGASLTANSGTGWVDVRATKGQDSVYNAKTSNTVRVSFTKGTQAALTLTPTSSQVSGTSRTYTAGGGTAGAFSDSLASGSATRNSALNYTANAGSGTYVISLTRAGDANYLPLSQNFTITMTKASQAPLTLSPSSTHTYGVSRAYSLGGGSAGSYGDSLLSGSATRTSSLTYTANAGTGSYTVRATRSGNSIYNSITQDFTISMGRASQTVAISPTSQTIIEGNSITFTSSGGQTGYNWGGEASGTGTSKTIGFPTPGNYTVTVSSPQDGNYAASNTATSTITVNPSSPGFINVPGSIAFDFVYVSAGSPLTSDKTLTVSNTGGQSLTLTGASLTGHTGDFSIVSYNGGSVSWPKVIPVSGSATIILRFNATAVGSRSAILTLTNDSSNDTSADIALNGSAGGGGSLQHSWGPITTW